ncbi:MAG: sigma factor-like helix-turn-helix DNA-binding protein, partial [Ktedonobacteraceae bacterium]
MVPGPEGPAEARIMVHETLLKMKSKDAACLHLHYGNSFTYEEIGHILGMTPEAVRKRVARSVEKFRELYGTSSQANKQ